jgi:hypothetical protein
VKLVNVVVGALLILAGVTFGLQGIGVLGGSAMSGETTWAVIGPLIAIVGVALVVSALRGRAKVSPEAGSARRDHSGSGPTG